jgi:cell division protein FtsZ
MAQMIQFEPKQEPAYIKVIGVGGGGSNAVNHMFKQGIKGVEFVVCNTDMQALETSPVPNKIRIGDNDGLGAGANPNVGEEAAKTSIDALKEAFTEDIKMVFITAGMGGGTGTGAAPIIAQLAKEMGVLTVGIVTLPFSWEGRRRRQQAESGIESIKQHVDTLLVINNDKLREQYSNLPVTEAFAKADNVLSTAAKGIAEIITVPGYVNTDFEDVKTVIKDSGKAIMGSAAAEGENRAMTAIEEAMNSPLLDDNEIKGAQNILLHIVTGTDEITIDEITEITEFVQTESGNDADLIWGQGYDESLGNKIGITIIATGFDSKKKKVGIIKPTKVHILGENQKNATENVKKEEPKLKEVQQDIEEKPVSDFIRLTKRDDQETVDTLHETTEAQFSLSKKTDTTISGQPTESEPKEPEKNPPSGRKDTENFPEEKPVVIKFERSTKRTPDQSHLSIQRTVNDFEIGISEQSHPLSREDETMEKNAQERVNKLKNLSRLHSADISKMESEPAFRRKNIDIDNTPPSTQTPISKFTLGEDSKNNPVIKSDNSYLYDNVD